MTAVRSTRATSPGAWTLAPGLFANTMVVSTVGFLGPLLVAMSDELGVPPAQLGQLVVVTALPWGLVAPFSGLVSDRFGRRPVILAALGGMALSTLFGAVASGFWMLVALRLLTGCFGSGGPPTIMAGLIDHFPANQRGRVVGWMNASFSLATLLGVPLVGAIGGLWGWRAAFVAAGLGLGLAGLAIWRWYPRPTSGSKIGGGNPIQAWGYLFRRQHLVTLLVSNVFERIAYMAMLLYLPPFLIQRYGLDAVSVAPVLTLIAIGALGGGVSGGGLADRFHRVRLSSSLMALSGVCALAAYLWPLHLVATVALGFGFGMLNAAGRPAYLAMLLGLADTHRGAMTGLFALSNQLGWALGAGLGGLVLGLSGYEGLGQLTFWSCLACGGLIVLARGANTR